MLGACKKEAIERSPSFLCTTHSSRFDDSIHTTPGFAMWSHPFGTHTRQLPQRICFVSKPCFPSPNVLRAASHVTKLASLFHPKLPCLPTALNMRPCTPSPCGEHSTSSAPVPFPCLDYRTSSSASGCMWAC